MHHWRKSIWELRSKKIYSFSGNWPGEKFFITHPARIVECVSEYMFLISKKKKKKKKTTKKKRNKKRKKKKRTKEKISGKSIKKRFAATRVKIFLVTRISGNKSIFFSWPNHSKFISKKLIKKIMLMSKLSNKFL